MRNIIIFLIIISAAFYNYNSQHQPDQSIEQPISVANQAIYDAYKNQRSDVQVRGTGIVSLILSDDLEGSRHQRFILRMESGQTVLVAHNIDLAPRINSLSEGDSVEFYGEYEFNTKGGVVHWTHHDPDNYHENGWLIHRGSRYE